MSAPITYIKTFDNVKLNAPIVNGTIVSRKTVEGEHTDYTITLPQKNGTVALVEDTYLSQFTAALLAPEVQALRAGHIYSSESDPTGTKSGEVVTVVHPSKTNLAEHSVIGLKIVQTENDETDMVVYEYVYENSAYAWKKTAEFHTAEVAAQKATFTLDQTSDTQITITSDKTFYAADYTDATKRFAVYGAVYTQDTSAAQSSAATALEQTNAKIDAIAQYLILQYTTDSESDMTQLKNLSYSPSGTSSNEALAAKLTALVNKLKTIEIGDEDTKEFEDLADPTGETTDAKIADLITKIEAVSGASQDLSGLSDYVAARTEKPSAMKLQAQQDAIVSYLKQIFDAGTNVNMSDINEYIDTVVVE